MKDMRNFSGVMNVFIVLTVVMVLWAFVKLHQIVSLNICSSFYTNYISINNFLILKKRKEIKQVKDNREFCRWVGTGSF